MASKLFKEFDRFLKKSDPSSIHWINGMKYEFGEKLIDRFSKKDWNTLYKKYGKKDHAWKRCLITIISPLKGVIAQDIILDMALSMELGIASDAMDIIGYYCGVLSCDVKNFKSPSGDSCIPDDAIVIPNLHGDGHDIFYIDEPSQHMQFMHRIRKHNNFISMIPDISKSILDEYYGDENNIFYVEHKLLQKSLIDEPAQTQAKT